MAAHHTETGVNVQPLEMAESSFMEELPHAVGDITTHTSLARADVLRVLTAGFSFFVAGVNDGSLGALIPYITRTYGISTGSIAILYGTTFLGWLIAFLTNSFFMQYLSFGGMLALGASFQLLAHALRSWLSPLPLFAVTFTLVGLGQAYQDTHANTFVAGVKYAHRWLGCIHACYAGGLLIGPFVATAVASSRTGHWSYFYIFPAGMGVINLVATLTAFRSHLGVRWQGRWIGPVVEDRQDHGIEPASFKTAIKDMQKTMSFPATWIVSSFFFFYLGSVITASSWIVEYLVVARGGELAKVGYLPAGFNGGAFLGRLLLAEPVHRLGERWTIFGFCVTSIGLQLVFWLVPNILAAAVAISVMGFLLGPFFAAGVSVASKLFPNDMKPSALGFVFVLGQVGANVFPAMTGLVAAKAGVRVLQPMLLSLLAATAVSWALIPKKSIAHRE